MLRTRHKSDYLKNKYFYLDKYRNIVWCAAYKMFFFAKTWSWMILNSFKPCILMRNWKLYIHLNTSNTPFLHTCAAIISVRRLDLRLGSNNYTARPYSLIQDSFVKDSWGEIGRLKVTGHSKINFFVGFPPYQYKTFFVI